MATMTDTSTDRKPRAYHCTFHGLSGIITKPDDHVLFLEHESGAVVIVTEADYPALTVLGEVAPAMAQYVADMAAGGYAAVCASRKMGVC